MSYCVNCGVELDKTASGCPLCQTPVLNPNSVREADALTPFPTDRGEISHIKPRDTAILSSVVLISTGASCGLLNLIVFNQNMWSLYIIGACVLLWIFCIPILIYRKLPVYFTILFDGLAVIMYLAIIAYQYPGNDWFLRLAVPTTFLLVSLILAFAIYCKNFRTSILSKATVIFSEIGILTAGIEILVRFYLNMNMMITWSAVVLTCCIIIVAALITIIKITRLREEVRRRMHI